MKMLNIAVFLINISNGSCLCEMLTFPCTSCRKERWVIHLPVLGFGTFLKTKTIWVIYSDLSSSAKKLCK